MPTASIVALGPALASGALETWLTGIDDATLRSRVRRALEIDRRVFLQYPDSPASCLLARTFGDPAFAALHVAWTAELDAHGGPWIRPLRGLPVPDGLIAELHPGAGVSFRGLDVPRFTSNSEVVVAPRRFPAGSKAAAQQRRRERLRWAWDGGEPVIEPDPAPAASPPASIVRDGWGPAYLLREPGAARIALPCPEGGSAEVAFTADGARLIVYGTLDEYAGGFVWIVDPGTLAVERRLATDSPVSAVEACGLDRMLVSTYRSGTIAWIDQEQHVLPDLGGELCLSPDGMHVASFAGCLRIWSLAALLRAGGRPPEPGFPATFDPTGYRLVCGRTLLDGRTGRTIAAISPHLDPYLEGGPAEPWLYFGTGALICSHGALQLWDARTGAPLKPRKRLGFPHWYALAYDRAGSRVAVLHHGHESVALHELPGGRLLRTLTFELAGTAVAMSPDGVHVAVQQGAAAEVRTTEGALVRHLGEDSASGRSQPRYGDPTLRFSTDGARLARFVEREGWRISAVSGDAAEQTVARDELARLADFAAPAPRDWTVAVATRTVFTHHPSGTRIALPVAGRWVFNPGEPRIAACDEMHVALCGPA